MLKDDIFKSAIGVVIAEITTLPICTIKSNYQNLHSTSMLNTIKQIYERNGIRSFYSGSIPAILGQVLSTSSKYTLYKQFEYYFGSNISLKPIYGSCSSIIVSLITHPIDLIKVNMQMGNNKFKDKNLRSFYNGYSKTFSKSIISGSLFLPMCDHFSNKTNSKFYGSLISATISTILMHPLDYLKTLQMYNLNNVNKINFFNLFTR